MRASSRLGGCESAGLGASQQGWVRVSRVGGVGWGPGNSCAGPGMDRTACQPAAGGAAQALLPDEPIKHFYELINNFYS